jgi:5-methyltetrahydrofolate--homocysteine methyltransferase
MEWLIGLIQETTDLPICLDSPDEHVLVDAMKFCNKEGLINSVSMEGAKINAIFPAIQGTNWSVVALLCDDQGIPSDAKRRLEIFEDIMAKAAEFDIAPSRIFIDPLVETLGTNGESLITFAEVTAEIKKRYPDVHITSGLSNISFGLPVRKLINSSFMTLAMNAGMDSAIIDPTNRDMMGTIFATAALLGDDFYCMEYIGAVRENRIGPVQA